MWEGRRQAVCSHSVRRVINFSPGCRSPAAPALWLRAFPAPLHLQRRNYSCWDLPLSRAISGLLPGTCTSLPPPPSTPTPFPALLPPCTPLILPAFSSSRQLQTRTPLFSFAGCSWEGGGGIFAVSLMPGDSRAAHRAMGPGGGVSVLPTTTARVLTCVGTSQPRRRGFGIGPERGCDLFFQFNRS